MRIAFVNPPRIGRKNKAVEAEDCCWGAGPLVLPAMLLACASEAKRAGHEASFVDLAIDGPTALKAVRAEVVVHALAWQWWQPVEEAMVRLCGSVPRIVLAVPPGYASHYAAYFVLTDAPERACGLLPRDVGRLEEWRYFVDGSLFNCLHTLGPVDFGLVPSHYWKHYKAAIYQVTRGCPYRCRFCVWGGSTVTDPTFRMRPAEQVAHDLKELHAVTVKETGRPIPLYLLAAQLTSRKRWLDAFHAEMATEPYVFQSNVNLAEVTGEKLRMLRKAGLTSTSVGLEAVTTPLLAKLGKPYNFEQALHGLLTLQESGIRWKAHVRYGFGETAGDVAESVANVGRMREVGIEAMRVDFAPIVHYEGTCIREEADYALKPLPGRQVECLVMAEPPDWSPFVAACREAGWRVTEGARK